MSLLTVNVFRIIIIIFFSFVTVQPRNKPGYSSRRSKIRGRGGGGGMGEVNKSYSDRTKSLTKLNVYTPASANINVHAATYDENYQRKNLKATPKIFGVTHTIGALGPSPRTTLQISRSAIVMSSKARA